MNKLKKKKKLALREPIRLTSLGLEVSAINLFIQILLHPCYLKI